MRWKERLRKHTRWRSLEVKPFFFPFLSFPQSRFLRIIRQSLIKFAYQYGNISGIKLVSTPLNKNCNSEAREWRHDSDKTQTNKLEWLMILKISLRAKEPVFLKHLWNKSSPTFPVFPQNTFTLTESRGEFSDLHSIFRLRALCYSLSNLNS